MKFGGKLQKGQMTSPLYQSIREQVLLDNCDMAPISCTIIFAQILNHYLLSYQLLLLSENVRLWQVWRSLIISQLFGKWKFHHVDIHSPYHDISPIWFYYRYTCTKQAMWLVNLKCLSWKMTLWLFLIRYIDRTGVLMTLTLSCFIYFLTLMS